MPLKRLFKLKPCLVFMAVISKSGRIVILNSRCPTTVVAGYPLEEIPDVRLTSQIPANAKVLHEPSPDLLGLAQSNALPEDQPPTASPDAFIQGLNRAIAKSDLIWVLGSTVVLGLSPAIVMKAGYGLDTDHISTMNYIKQHAPGLPIPEIYGTLQAECRSFVFMTRIKGDPLDKVWKSLSQVQKHSIKEQLAPMFAVLRSLRPPTSDEPHAILGGGTPRRCKDARRDIRLAGRPIENEVEFNQFLTTHRNRTETPWLAMIRSFLVSNHKLAMTHGDLHPRNIMVVKSDASPYRLA
jgi:hypothetical protein